MKCFYHNDNDGLFAAACVDKFYKGYDIHGKEFIAINYNQPFPFDTINAEEIVWIVDYSISPGEMRRLLSITKNVIWIDHHKTAIEKYKDFDKFIYGERSVNDAACVLTYKYLTWWTDSGVGEENFEVIGPEVPKALKLVADRDLRKFEYGNDTRRFHAGVLLHNYSVSNMDLGDLLNVNNTLTDDLLNAIIDEGRIVVKYMGSYCKELKKSFAYETEFHGILCLVMNVGMYGSEAFGEDIDKYQMVITYIHDGCNYTVSLYSSKTVDVSVIAKEYGGGGHAGAAGFVCKELPFKKLVRSECSCGT